MAKLFHPEAPTGEPCEPTPTVDGLQLAGAGGDVGVLPYAGVHSGLGGFEKDYIVLTHSDLPYVQLWLRAEEVEWLATPASGAPEGARRLFGAMVAARTEVQQKSRVKQFVWFAILGMLGMWMFSGAATGCALMMTPRAFDAALQDAMDTGEGLGTPCDAPELQRAVEAMLVRLVASVEVENIDFRVTVLQDDVVNAFAAPGGALFVNSGLIRRTERPDELAAVLGHEVAHVLHRDSMRRLLREAGTMVALGVLLGDASEAAATIGLGASELMGLGFDRDQERDADTVGLQLMRSAGYDGRAAVHIFGRMAAEEGADGSLDERVLALVQTHPATAERIERLRALAGDGDVVTDSGWTIIRELCSPGGN